uniref:Uncharacterized protein n=1 Tax=Physcomitrium patens TaxID=3218 RepID=A0A2K1II01_PHYPA|nr:hypothetical protein PHYPA_027601 [Physcomitrium patens]
MAPKSGAFTPDRLRRDEYWRENSERVPVRGLVSNGFPSRTSSWKIPPSYYILIISLKKLCECTPSITI